MDPLHRVLSTPELLRLILSHVPHEDDMNCALTCKLWADIARDFLWHCVRDIRPLLQLLAPLATDDDGERYYFSGPIKPSNWRRFQTINFRVRALHIRDQGIDPSVYITIARERPFQALLPNLRKLHGYPDPQTTLLFSNTSVSELTFFAKDADLEVILPYIPTRMPNLVDLSILMSPGDDLSPFAEMIGSVFSELSCLRTLFIPMSMTLPTITYNLSRLPSLEYVRAYRSMEDRSVEYHADMALSEKLTYDSFPSLEILHLSSSFAKVSVCLSSQFTPASLKEISVVSSWDEAPAEHAALISTIARYWPKVERILVQNNDNDQNPLALPFGIVEPLMGCRHLRSLTLAFPSPLEPTEAEFIRLLKALPCLRSLDIGGGTPINGSRPRLSMYSLAALVPFTQALEHLGVYMSFRPRLYSTTSATPISRFKSLKTLNVGFSPAKGPSSVVAFLDRILPDHCVVACHPRRRRLDDDHLREDLWKEVVSTLDSLRAARNEFYTSV
ncbi:hypothetical protein ONZ45_g6263 [Pleurotus djamor]|nr:hypothetical protein ONZ45_g6263 [Pleurotus djamor]